LSANPTEPATVGSLNIDLLTSPRKRVNPATDLLPDGRMFFTVFARLNNGGGEFDELPVLVLSNRTFVTADELMEKTDIAFSSPPPICSSRWSIDSVKRFLTGRPPKIPTLKEVFERLEALLRTLIDFDVKHGYYKLIPLWVIATYFISVFRTFPYLAISGSFESGKTKLLEFLHQTCFNAIMTSNISDPSLFRVIESTKGTILIDEALGIQGVDERGRSATRRAMLLDMLNAGYKKGAPAIRSDKTNKGIQPRSFDLFGGKAFITYRGCDMILESRSLPVTMVRTDKPQANAEIREDDPVWQDIRDSLFHLALENYQRVREIYHSEKIENLPFRGRRRELWRPILTIALLIDEKLYEEVLEFAKEVEETLRLELERPEFKILEGLVRLSASWGEKETHEVTAAALRAYLIENVVESDEEKKIYTPQLIARTLSRTLGFPSRPMGRVKKYLMTRERIWELARRYDLNPEQILAGEKGAVMEELERMMVDGQIHDWEVLCQRAVELSPKLTPAEVFGMLEAISRRKGLVYINLDRCPSEEERDLSGLRHCQEHEVWCGVRDIRRCPFGV
jgi:hypothetical protein